MFVSLKNISLINLRSKKEQTKKLKMKRHIKYKYVMQGK